MKKTLWLFVASRLNPEVPAVVPTLAWLAEDAGAEFEMYLEDRRDGLLFAQSGSTVLGGRHFQQFNYLHAVFEVQYVLLGPSGLFRSSLARFGAEVLAEADTAETLYQVLGAAGRAPEVVVPCEPPAEGRPDLRPYYYPEVYFRRALGIPRGVGPDEDYRTFTVRTAERWIDRAHGVAFGDPDAILSMLATLCREKRVALYGECRYPSAPEVVASAYTEACSVAAEDVVRLAAVTGNRVIVGRQTADGDLFEWSKAGVAIRIMDPNRPAFPVVCRVEHAWHNRTDPVFAHEPDDETLETWLAEGKTLASLLVHSGEMAHNEAMLNLIELSILTGLELGIGVHVARYESCPQLWELISVPQSQGGALGLIEPVLHSGGRGVLAESTCPPELLAEHCRHALDEIDRIAGPSWRPRGHLYFMDTDMPTFTRTMPAVYDAVAGCGLDYSVSSALPGRNRILYSRPDHVVLNQGSRAITTGSPFVRVTTVEDLREKTPGPAPGWWLGVIDAPVIAFNSYIWRTWVSTCLT